MAIGVSMMCMALLRRLPTWGLLGIALSWIVLGEIVTRWFWMPFGNSSKLAAFVLANYSSPTVRFAAGQSKVSGRRVLLKFGYWAWSSLRSFEASIGYSNMFLHPSDNSWQQWLHVSKYPPSLAYYSLELGILFPCLALLKTLELRIGVPENGVLYVF
jgi:hypothetical protein